jgi:hypothetical protein
LAVPAGPVRPRPLKKLATAFEQLAGDVRYRRVDAATARVMLSALDRELRCLELQLRYGPGVNRVWNEGA